MPITYWQTHNFSDLNHDCLTHICLILWNNTIQNNMIIKLNLTLPTLIIVCSSQLFIFETHQLNTLEILKHYRASPNKLCIAIASPVWLFLNQISSTQKKILNVSRRACPQQNFCIQDISWGLKISRAIAILSWRGETVISSSRVLEN